MTALSDAMAMLEVDLASFDEPEAYDTRFDRMRDVAALVPRCLEELDAGGEVPHELRGALDFVLAYLERWVATCADELGEAEWDEMAPLIELRDRLPPVPRSKRTAWALDALRSHAERLCALLDALDAGTPEERRRRVETLLFDQMSDPFDTVPRAFGAAEEDDEALAAFVALAERLREVGFEPLQFAMIAEPFVETLELLTPSEAIPDPTLLPALREALARAQLQ